MPDDVECLKDAESFEEIRERLGRMIHLPGPAPAAVARRAVADRRFAFYLLFTRDAPRLRQQLLDDPQNAAYAAPSPAEDASSLALAGRALRAVARWGAAGFATADAATFERRWSRCLACPHLVEAPDRVIYKGMTILAGDRHVCGLCGCIARSKAKLPSESCPAPHPDDPALTRWGEPRAARHRS